VKETGSGKASRGIVRGGHRRIAGLNAHSLPENQSPHQIEASLDPKARGCTERGDKNPVGEGREGPVPRSRTIPLRHRERWRDRGGNAAKKKATNKKKVEITSKHTEKTTDSKNATN